MQRSILAVVLVLFVAAPLFKEASAQCPQISLRVTPTRISCVAKEQQHLVYLLSNPSDDTYLVPLLPPLRATCRISGQTAVIKAGMPITLGPNSQVEIQCSLAVPVGLTQYTMVVDYAGITNRTDCCNGITSIVNGYVPTPTPSPTPTPTPTIPRTATPTRKAGVVGDPHMVTFDGRSGTMFKSGDFVLMSSASSGMAMYSRFRFFDTNVRASWLGSVAIRCSSTSDRVELTPGMDVIPAQALEEFTNLRLVSIKDGKVLELTCLNSGFSLLLVAQTMFGTINYFDLIVANTGSIVSSLGLMGSPDGNQTNDFTFRNGTVWPAGVGLARAGSAAFQESWRVTPTDPVLFSTPFPETPSDGALYSDMSTSLDADLMEEGRWKCAKAFVPTQWIGFCAQDYVALGGNEDIVNNFQLLTDSVG